ncbi:MAG TPA: pyridoxamine 5'-phosphate oxidase family protein [Gemmatimonadaceae bacterium]|nr:pyridoxamine 5'-phosphate oxidase family protein [Gemmatimonadaceae bacterium]
MTDERRSPADEAAPSSSGGRARGPDPSAIVEMEHAECVEVLTRQRLCVLALTDGEQPYAVPVFYGFDGATVYLGISEGRKTRILDNNPRLCFTVSEVGPGDSWRSVVVMGRAEWVTDPAQRAEAIQVLMRHNRRPERQASAAPPPADGAPPPRRHSGGRMLRIEDAQMSGRAKR